MEVIFYNINKRANSTKQPSGGTTIDCTLKWEGTDLKHGRSYEAENSILSPVLSLYYDGIFPFNYARLFNNYYHIINVAYGVNQLINITCVIDYLATYKADILNTRAYVLYSANTYSLDIDDSRNVCKESQTFVMASTTFLANFISNPVEDKGTFIMNVIGEPPGQEGDNMAQGFVSTYYLNRTQMELVAGQMVDPTITESLANTFLQPTDAVVSFSYTTLSFGENIRTPDTMATGIKMGNVTIDVPVSAMPANKFYTSESIIPIPRKYSDYREGGRISKYILKIPFAGDIELDADLLYDAQAVKLHTAMDAATTNFAGYVETVPKDETIIKGVVLSDFNGCLSTPMPIGQTMPFVGGIMTAMTSAGALIGGAGAIGTASTVGSTLSSMAAGAGIGSAAGVLGPTFAALGVLGVGAAKAAINAAKTGASIIRAGTARRGTIGGSLGFTSSGVYTANADQTAVRPMINLIHIYQETCDTPTAIREVAGLPLNKTMLLSSLTGFVQTHGASVSGSMLQSIREQINNALEGGIYIE